MVPRANLIAVVAIAPFAILLMILATASGIASFSTLSTDPITDAAQARMPIPPLAALAAGEANASASRWFEPGRYAARAARVLIALPADKRGGELKRIEQLVRTSLGRAPMSSYNWALLSWLRLEADDVPSATQALELSLLTGRFAPDLVSSRLQFGIRLSARDRQMTNPVREQVVLYAEANPDGLALMARNTGNEPFIRAALVATPRERAAFEVATAKLVAAAVQRVSLPAARPAPPPATPPVPPVAGSVR